MKYLISILIVLITISSHALANSYLDNITINNADDLIFTDNTLELNGSVDLKVNNINSKIKTINVSCNKVIVSQNAQGKVRLIEFLGQARIYNAEINIQAQNITLETNPKTEDIEILHARKNTLTKINKPKDNSQIEIKADLQDIYFVQEYLIASGHTHSFINNTNKQESINLHADMQKIHYSPQASKVLHATDNITGNFNEYNFTGEEVNVLRNNNKQIEKAIIKNNAEIITQDNKITADELILSTNNQNKILYAKQYTQDTQAKVTTKDYTAKAQKIILIQNNNTEKEEKVFLLDKVSIKDNNNKQLIESDYIEINPKTNLFKARSLSKSVSGYLIKE